MAKNNPFKKGYKYRIYPTPDQIVFLEKTFGCCRKVWNVLLAEAIEEYQLYHVGKAEKSKVSPFDFSLKLTLLKRREEYSYLNEISSKALQYAAHGLGRAFQTFFKKKSGFPKFKSKHKSRTSFTLESAESYAKYFWIKDGVFTISKLELPIEVIWDRELPSYPTQVTISKDPSGKYFASFLCEYTPEVTNGQGIVGIDLGIKTLATQSNGVLIENPRHYVKAQKRLAFLQRRLAKKLKGSKNRLKARLKVALYHEKIRNQRQHHLHNLTRRLVNENEVIVIEDLNVSGMSKNRHLSKHILDAGFGMFRQMLTYKVLESQWCKLIIADQWYPSTQMCSVCSSLSKTKIDLKQRSWTCGSCNTSHCRDSNASRNLSNIGVSIKESYKNVWHELAGKIILAPKYEDLISV